MTQPHYKGSENVNLSCKIDLINLKVSQVLINNKFHIHLNNRNIFFVGFGKKTPIFLIITTVPLLAI